MSELRNFDTELDRRNVQQLPAAPPSTPPPPTPPAPPSVPSLPEPPSSSGGTTVAEARRWVMAHRRQGVYCPACDQLAKIYRRPLPAKSAMILIRMYRAAGIEYQHVPTLRKILNLGDDGDTGKLAYWGLAVEADQKRPDGGRAGWWCVTELGALFVRGMATVPRYALIYDSECLGLEGDRVTIQEILGTRFNYDELMAS